MPSPLGQKLRAVRRQKKISLDRLAELTDSSKSYLWELENKDTTNPSVEKISRLAAALEVTTDFLMSEAASDPDAEVIDEAFFRKYKTMPETTKRRLRKILDTLEDE